MCMAYGVGAALTLDEFALWLNLRDVYWERDGRESFEAMAVFAGALCIGIFGQPFFRGVGQGVTALLRRGPLNRCPISGLTADRRLSRMRKSAFLPKLFPSP